MQEFLSLLEIRAEKSANISLTIGVWADFLFSVEQAEVTPRQMVWQKKEYLFIHLQ